ncbi:MAG: UxaA family hydrolase [Aigarchaeota archaeon]|nr:UxaA family hydrolase [Candidatus Calditenuaceae archaeon]
MRIKVYPRRDSVFRFGIRNKVIVVSVGASANHAVRQIARRTGSAALVHDKGTDGELGEDAEITKRTIINTVLNPNVYGALLVGLGDERYNANDIASELERFKHVSWLHVQEIGERTTITKGVRLIKELKKEAAESSTRQSKDISGLTVGVKCGASDYTSVFANAVVGLLVDRVVSMGGRIVFTETPELIGMESHLYRRCISRGTAKKLKAVIQENIRGILSYSRSWIGAQPNYGNIRGGITTIEEKSAGAVLKTGTSKIIDVLRYGERIERREPGVYFVDGPGFDVPAITALAASGCHAKIFTTGSGEPIGSPVSPTIKVTANNKTYNIMRDNMDLDLSPALSGVQLNELAEKLFILLKETVNGRLTAAERAAHEDFAILKNGPTL